VSRYGKAALIAAAFDQRFAMVLIGSSGEGGVKPHRRNWGEAVENLTGMGAYHWMAGNFLKYGGPLHAGDLPVDSSELLALVAPRLAFVSYGVPEKGMRAGSIIRAALWPRSMRGGCGRCWARRIWASATTIKPPECRRR
jgi:hypothetical protein